MTRVLIASTYVPFIKGGGTAIVDSLEATVRKHGYDVDTVRIPLRSYWRELLSQTLAIRSLDVTNASGDNVDTLITIRYPSFALQHPNKRMWFIHHHRTAYDLWGTPYQDVTNDAEGLHFREMLKKSDTLYMREARKIYTISKVLVNRLKQFNDIDADGVLYHPLPNAELFKAGGQGDYFLFTSRINSIKRQSLAIEAMQYVRSDFKLLLVGKTETDEYEREVQALVERCGVKDKVIFKGWVSEEEKAILTANCVAAFYLAYDEDSYGYSTLEAFHSHKPVITCTDSGGTLDVIVDGQNGLVVQPTPKAVAQAMEQLWAKKALAAEMGQDAYETISRHQITWDRVVDCLVS
jgi:glycosyltransferase involved in cell wall biosynthesis